jgi:hypothetical protein
MIYSNYTRYLYDNIEIYSTTDMHVKETFDGIILARIKASEYFKQGFPQDLRIALAPSRSEYDRIAYGKEGTEDSPITPATRIAQPLGEREIVFLSPVAYCIDSDYEYKKEEYLRLLLHEYVHVIARYYNSKLPRWFEEGLAVYVSEQWKYEDELSQYTYNAIITNSIPSLRIIMNSREYYFRWAWTIIHYIERKYGHKTILELIESLNINSRIHEILGMPIATLDIQLSSDIKSNINLYYPALVK